MVPLETYLPEWWITRVLSGDIERPLYRRHSASVPLRRDDISVVGLEFACERAENQRTQQRMKARSVQRTHELGRVTLRSWHSCQHGVLCTWTRQVLLRMSIGVGCDLIV